MKWISITIARPRVDPKDHESERMLVSLENGDVRIGTYDAQTNEWHDDYGYCLGGDDMVVAWKPLSKPYKAQNPVIIISANGVAFKGSVGDLARPTKRGKWIEKNGGRIHYCSECGWALMDTEGGDIPYMGIDYNRDNPERWTCCPGWREDLMNYCPCCGADMRDEDETD